MKHFIIAVIIAPAFLVIIAAHDAIAQQPNCAPLRTMQTFLETGKYNERRMFSSEIREGASIEFYMNANTQTWSMLLASPMQSCMIISGRGMKFDNPPPSGKPI